MTNNELLPVLKECLEDALDIDNLRALGLAMIGLDAFRVAHYFARIAPCLPSTHAIHSDPMALLAAHAHYDSDSESDDDDDDAPEKVEAREERPTTAKANGKRPMASRARADAQP